MLQKEKKSKSFDAGMPKSLRWFKRAHYLNKLSDPAIVTLIKNTRSLPELFTVAYLEPMGGEVNRVDPAATAFPHRNAAYSLHIFPGLDDPSKDGENIRWAKEFSQPMQKEVAGGVYVNLLSQDEKERVKGAYGRKL